METCLVATLSNLKLYADQKNEADYLDYTGCTKSTFTVMCMCVCVYICVYR